MFRAASIKTCENFTGDVGRRLGESLQRRLGQTPDACWLFCAPLAGMDALIQGICESAGTDQLVGCTTSGEISGSGLSINSAVLAGIVSDDIDFEIVTIPELGKDSEAAGRRLAESLSATPACIHIFSDGLTGNGCAILRGIAAVFGDSVPVSGGAAGDNGEFRKTCQFGAGRIYTDAVCGIAFHGDFGVGVGVHSGWAPVGLPKRVTRAIGRVVYELNGEPALDVYERFLGPHARKLPVIGVEYPLGFVRGRMEANAHESYVLRASMSVNHNDRSITFAGEIPEGAMVNLTCGDKSSILDAAALAARDVKSAIGGRKPGIIFCYSCMARRIVLGPRTTEEISRIRTEFGPDIPIVGFYSYGEFCPMGSPPVNCLHNESLTLSVIGI